MARPLRVGVQLPEVERVVDWPQYAALARAAEEAGFDSIWLGDHMLYRDDGAPERGPWDAWTTLAALAAVTRRARLGPLVACTAFHPPGVLARMAAAVNEVSDGRLVFGLGLILAFLAVGLWWVASAHKWFRGPKVMGTPEELAAIEHELDALEHGLPID